MLGLVVRSVAAFVLASIGGGVGLLVGSLVGLLLEVELVGALAVGRRVDALSGAAVLAGTAFLAACASFGAALFSLLPIALAGVSPRPWRALVGACAGALLYAAAGAPPPAPFAAPHLTMLLIPLGAAIGASWSRPDRLPRA